MERHIYSMVNRPQVLCLCIEQATRCLEKPTIPSILQCGSLGLCCAALLFGDNRLSAMGLACAIPAAVALGLARLLPTSSTTLALDTLLPIVCGIMVTSICVLLKEWDAIEAIGNLTISDVVWLLTNTASSAVAVTMGNSCLVLMGPLEQHKRFLASLLTLAGCGGCLSVLLTQRSYTTGPQLAAYGIALSALYILHRPKKGQDQLDTSVSSQRPVAVLWCDGASDAASHTVEPMDPHCSTSLGAYDLDTACSYLGAGIGLVAWILFLAITFTPNTSATAPAKLDYTFHPNIKVEVVISMYHEPVESVASLVASLQRIPALADAQVHIYTKDAIANKTFIQAQTGAHRVTQLDNIGRESETYLHHILSRWNFLSRHTLFVQAEVHNQKDLLWRLQTFFDPSYTGMLDLGFSGQSYSCAGQSSDRWGWRDHAGLVSHVYASIHHAPCSNVLLSYKGQFIVSASRIRGISKDIYYHLYRALLDPDGWAHQEKFLHGRTNSMSKPMIGYTIERLWNVLFQCADIATARSCPSYLGIGFFSRDRASCQCLDR
jgi:hypothetical protein